MIIKLKIIFRKDKLTLLLGDFWKYLDGGQYDWNEEEKGFPDCSGPNPVLRKEVNR